MILVPSHFRRPPRILQRVALPMLLVVAASQAALAVPGFTPQTRLGYHTGDQWEPAMAADGRGHIYVLYPQYGAVPECPACTAPSMTLLVSNDNGLTWQAPRPMLPFPTGQFDPQIVVDPVATGRRSTRRGWRTTSAT